MVTRYIDLLILYDFISLTKYIIWFNLYNYDTFNNLNLQLLYSSNASKFATQLLAPSGCLPIPRQEYKTGNECYEPHNDLAKQHNEKIGLILNGLTNVVYIKQDFTCQTRHVVVWGRMTRTTVVW